MATHTRTVGDIKVTAIRDGFLQSSLGVVLRADIETCERLTGVKRDTVLPMPTYVFLVEAVGRKMLVDCGAGLTMGPTMGKLPGGLKALGLAPGDIDTILATHLHPDHVDGLLDPSGAPTFPNAEIVLHEVEAAFWLDGPLDAGPERAQMRRPKARAALAPYRDRIRRVGDGEAMPGVSAMLLPGHTPGHTGWLFASRGESLLMWGDVVHIAKLQGPRPDAVMVYDLDPDRAHATRLDAFSRAADEGAVVAGSHLDAPGFARVERDGGAYRIVPAE